ncbi:glycosyltransferase [Sporolactobacillus vineae]|uniref:glycosyltransferase n=1 Tax=Sporolactobacillus vineae TaxID=444463 RepID=UPI0002883CF2|nr:glycosyltransferase [Sporolactobacillus vineae]
MIIDIVLGYAVGIGGLENVIKLISDELMKRGHLVRIFQIAPPKYLNWAEQFSNIYYYGDEVHVYTPLDQETVDLFSSNYERLTQFFGRPDVILATHTPVMSWLCRLAVNKMNLVNKPAVLSWLHGPPNVFGGESYLKLCDAHLAISNSIANQIANYVGEEKIFYIGNPIDFNNITPLRRVKKQLKLIYVGRLDNVQKRLDVLFKGLEKLKGKWTLSIFGDGNDKSVLQDLAKELGIDENIIWQGWHDEPWKQLVSASLLVLSSDFEGFGLVVVESLARGLPVVSSASEGPNEIIRDGYNGWLFPCGDSKMLKNILQDIIDGKKVLPCEEQCRKSVENYRVESVVHRLESAIKDTLKNNN